MTHQNKRLYFTCPIKALFMQREFGVKFEMINHNNAPSTLFEVDRFELAQCLMKNSDCGRILVIKESESILMPKEGDVVQSAECIGVFYGSSPYDDGTGAIIIREEEPLEIVDNSTIKILKRDGKSFLNAEMSKATKLINDFIKHLEGTQNSEWLLDKCAETPELKKCCIVGHFFKFADVIKNQGNANRLWDDFSYDFANEYMLYPVNDGKDKNYQQTTPRQRCIAYLKDLRDGNAKTTKDLIEEDMKEWEAGND